MGTTTKVAFRTLSASALVVFIAACAQEQQPLEPDARANIPQTADVAVRVARVIEPGELGLANPAGLTFSPQAGTLLLVTRTPGMPPGSMTDIELITLAEDRAGTVRIAAGVTDPVNMAFDGNADRLLIFESSNNRCPVLGPSESAGLDGRSGQRTALHSGRDWAADRPRRTGSTNGLRAADHLRDRSGAERLVRAPGSRLRSDGRASPRPRPCRAGAPRADRDGANRCDP
jgi:hypothetical protein